MNRIISLGLALILASLSPFSALAFTDVSSSTHYNDAIEWMSNNEVIDGYPDDSFKPDDCVNRAEFLKMLYLSYGEEIVDVKDTSFPDVKSDAWYFPYVAKALEQNFVQGYPDLTFRPSDCVSRVEAIKMAVLKFNDGEIPGVSGLHLLPLDIVTEFDGDEWWYPYYIYTFSSGTVGIDHFAKFNVDDWTEYGLPSTAAPIQSFYFGPGDGMTRKEVAELLYRTKTVKDNSLYVYNDSYSPDAIVDGLVNPILTAWDIIEDYVLANYPISKEYFDEHFEFVESTAPAYADIDDDLAYSFDPHVLNWSTKVDYTFSIDDTEGNSYSFPKNAYLHIGEVIDTEYVPSDAGDDYDLSDQRFYSYDFFGITEELEVSVSRSDVIGMATADPECNGTFGNGFDAAEAEENLVLELQFGELLWIWEDGLSYCHINAETGETDVNQQLPD